MNSGPLSRTAALARAKDSGRSRYRVDEDDFCSDGWPFAGRPIRRCIGCGRPEPRRQLRVRDVDGTTGWLPVIEAIRRGGRL
jgi:hypothetical protein